MITDFKTSLTLGQEIEVEVAKALDFDTYFVPKGKYRDFDIIGSKNNITTSYEVKHHTEPFKYIPYQFFELYKLEPLGILNTKADFWVDVINWQNKKFACINKTNNLVCKIKNIISEKRALNSMGGRDKNIFLINILVEDVFKFTEKTIIL